MLAALKMAYEKLGGAVRLFDVWCEGYECPAAPNNSRPAYLIGKANGETFLQAVENFRFTEDKVNSIGHYSQRKGESLSLFRNQDGSLRLKDGQPVYNMLRLYDNEADAKRTKYVAPKPRRR